MLFRHGHRREARLNLLSRLAWRDMTQHRYRSMVIVMLIALPVANDTGGWLAGIIFGKHPMAPSVSPKKSWEGFAGSVVAAVLAGVLCLWGLGGPVWAGALLGSCTVVVSTLGDLGESLLKRDLGLKDMGTLLPGHGGLMDRLDSILVAAPLVYLFTLIVW